MRICPDCSEPRLECFKIEAVKNLDSTTSNKLEKAIAPEHFAMVREMLLAKVHFCLKHKKDE